ncbi:MAG TPA: OmpA family protein [Terriglobales bacterium]|nr:OmpA family protein [Terriglobales bacterium]
MNRIMLFAAVGMLSLSVTTGCATKKHVRNEAAPIINKVNELDELTAKNANAIKDVDARSQQGIQQVNEKAATADQKALAAGQAADQAQQAATQASNRVSSLANTVANLDNYRPVVETSVHFGFDKSNLTSRARKALDQLGAEIGNARSYIIVVDGNTDSVGPADYNYVLSQRRADSVVQYLASKYNVPAHKLYVIGLGKDKPVEENSSSAGRAKNRRVDIRLMTNTSEAGDQAAQAQQPSPQQ